MVILKFKFHPTALVFALPEKLFQILINLLYIYQTDFSVFVKRIRVFGKPLDRRESYAEQLRSFFISVKSFRCIFPVELFCFYYLFGHLITPLSSHIWVAVFSYCLSIGSFTSRRATFVSAN